MKNRVFVSFVILDRPTTQWLFSNCVLDINFDILDKPDIDALTRIIKEPVYRDTMIVVTSFQYLIKG